MAEMSYTKTESQDINVAFATLEEWAEKHYMLDYVCKAFDAELKEFKGNSRMVQARASILRVAYDAMYNENEPVKPSIIFQRRGLAMVYLAISHRINGWEGRSTYGDKLEALAYVRDIVHGGVRAHIVAWDKYWAMSSDNFAKAAMSLSGNGNDTDQPL